MLTLNQWVLSGMFLSLAALNFVACRRRWRRMSRFHRVSAVASTIGMALSTGRLAFPDIVHRYFSIVAATSMAMIVWFVWLALDESVRDEERQTAAGNPPKRYNAWAKPDPE